MDDEHISIGSDPGADLDEGATETSSSIGSPEKNPRGRKPDRKKKGGEIIQGCHSRGPANHPGHDGNQIFKERQGSERSHPTPLLILMQFVSWNCRGLGSKPKEEAIKDIVKMNSPEILLIQETKMEEPETIQASKLFWKKGDGRAFGARGASGGLATFWNSSNLDLLEDHSTIHWLFTKL